ncbi:MAG: four helix bundle protein [Acidimicrobiia bacterium]|nr:four helix bundle protein [Acidimicrobiia bacterium]NNF09617.1 four helix bundle protein [Acidimicrobiia bacterium]NNL70786.1 four helix bundle protein [Acidimicrobiia bacterium]
MSNYRDLTVWNAARALAVSCYRSTQDFPRAEEYGLTSQIRRAAVSIAANIAEGTQRGSDRELIRFVRIARGSAAELETLLELAGEVGLLTPQHATSLLDRTGDVGRMLSGLARSLNASNHRPITKSN